MNKQFISIHVQLKGTTLKHFPNSYDKILYCSVCKIQLGSQYETRYKKNSHCAVKNVMHRKRVTYELHDSYFRSITITQAIPKIAEVTHPDRQISEEIAEALRRVHISALEFEGNIRPTNWTEGSEKDPAVHEADLVVTLCVVSAIVYLHRRVQA